MKWLFLFIAVYPAAGLMAQAAEGHRYEILVCKDKTTGKESARGSKDLNCSTDGQKGFVVSVLWEVQEGVVSYAGVTIQAKGMGPCHENDLLQFTFDDQQTLTLRSWTGMDCEGKARFDYPRKSLPEISPRKLISLKLSNGMSTDTYTFSVPQADQAFFQEAKAAFDQKYFSQAACPK